MVAKKRSSEHVKKKNGKSDLQTIYVPQDRAPCARGSALPRPVRVSCFAAFLGSDFISDIPESVPICCWFKYQFYAQNRISTLKWHESGTYCGMFLDQIAEDKFGRKGGSGSPLEPNSQVRV